ncbi:MAG: ribonuclease E/G [Butyrivibrio sp.]|nr:ribonuclease E/G [Butyrivibrio sp.]
MSERLVITRHKNKILSMLMRGQREIRLELYDTDGGMLPGDIYIARVRDLVPNIGAAFAEIARGTVCYFSLKENPEPIFLNPKNTSKVCQGDLLLVQIKKAAAKAKAPVASSKITLAGKRLALTREQAGSVGVSRKIKDRGLCDRLKAFVLPYVNGDYGFIVRTDAAEASEEEILSELYALKDEYEALLSRAASRPAFTLLKRAESPLLQDVKAYRLTGEDEIVTDLPDIYRELSEGVRGAAVRLYADELLPLTKLYDTEHRLEMALKPRVWLKSGGYLIIEPTEALTVIDVNTGKFDGSERDMEKTFLKINLEACAEIARQLILRNISGIIIADFINMADPRAADLLEKKMRELLAEDPVRAVFVEFTKLGLMEITRKKIRKPLREAAETDLGGAKAAYENINRKI